MTLREAWKRSEKLIIDNSPGILTAIGVAGTVTTAYLAGTASIRAYQIIENEKEHRNMMSPQVQPLAAKLTAKETIQATWYVFVPTVGVGGLTLFSIIFANRIGARRTAAIAAAYSLSEKAFVEYKEKVVERLGEKEDRKIRDDLAQDRVSRTPLPVSQEIIIMSGDVLCFDSLTVRYFQSNMEAMRKAQNDVNEWVIQNTYASLGDFQNLLGLPITEYSEEVGWNIDRMLELSFSSTLTEDGKPCMVIDYSTTPIRGYHKIT